ncbi:hypothetical protein FB45DRAFT_1034169 [Roridomyces roridus]|uniref:Uncharacterized protein n=1 Tax=Roridomyces roridus TaxID=1738132 RepID=A0AAD7BDF2_9AGAR|nr:hypothetical protein FB45DRAFT_1034169 [Roridomyces roridus]
MSSPSTSSHSSHPAVLADLATGERYQTFDAHLHADARPLYHKHAHIEPCKYHWDALASFGLSDGEAIERPWDLLASKTKKPLLPAPLSLDAMPELFDTTTTQNLNPVSLGPPIICNNYDLREALLRENDARLEREDRGDVPEGEELDLDYPLHAPSLPTSSVASSLLFAQPPPPKPTAAKKSNNRKREKAHTKRKQAAQAAESSIEPPAPTPRMLKKAAASSPIELVFDAAKFRAAHPRWTGLPGTPNHPLFVHARDAEYLKEHLQYADWQGEKTHVLVDKHGHVIGALVAPPLPGKSWAPILQDAPTTTSHSSHIGASTRLHPVSLSSSMPPRVGRPPLAPAVKEANLENAKAKYEEDNRELRARKSRERMQRKRAAIAKDPIAHSKAKQKAAHHSETYRDRKWVEAQAAARQAEAIQKAAANRMRKEEMERHLPARRQREVVSKSASGSTTPGLSLSAIHAADSDDEEFHVQNAGLLGPMRCAGCHSEECSTKGVISLKPANGAGAQIVLAASASVQ